VADACGEDAALWDELTSLLEVAEAAAEYFTDVSERLIAPTLSALARAEDEAAGPEAMEALQVKLAGVYHLERELGGGGMSSVFLAEDLRLRRHVVMKVLPPETIPTGNAERFRREIEFSARLQHPHIVPLLDTDSVGGTLYYTMPFVSGESLRERLGREGALPLDDALRILRDLLDALGHAHENGIVHRDVKPGNILLSGRNALVTDFGIAAAVETASVDERATLPGLTVGTPAYMAPEQAAGSRNADHRCDIYSAGLVMYEMLAGRLPFPAGSPHELIRAHVLSDPEQLVRADASPQLLALVMQCLARDPAVRPWSAETILSELDALEEPQAAAADDELARRRRRRIAAYAIAGLVLAAVGFAAVRRSARTSGTPVPVAAPSIAVLPLTNLSADPDDAGLADALTQELTATLAGNWDLRVIASTSVLALQGRRLSVGQIADSLHVSHVLEGSLQKAGSRLRMQVRLVDARDGSTRWSETYDRQFADVLDVQNDIAQAVARGLAVRLTSPMETGSRARRHTPDVAAYEWYLRGMDLALLRTDTGRQQAIEYYERAVAADSMYAAAHAGLARIYIHIWNGAPGEEREGWLEKARAAALTAVALDDSDAEALAALGWVRWASRDMDGAEESFERAIALDPRVPRGHEGLARLFMVTDRPAEQLSQARLGFEDDPFSHSAIRELALALATNGRCEESLDQLRSLKALSPPAAVAGVISGQCYASRRMWPEAIEEFRWAVDNSAGSGTAFLGFALARAGRRAEADSLLSQLLTGRSDSHGAFGVAVIYAGLRDYDRAFAWIEKAIDDNTINTTYIMHPLFADLQRDPRFGRVRERMDLSLQ